MSVKSILHGCLLLISSAGVTQAHSEPEQDSFYISQTSVDEIILTRQLTTHERNYLIDFETLQLTYIGDGDTVRLAECIPENWNGHWNSEIRECYANTVDQQVKSLTRVMKDDALNAIVSESKRRCTRESEEFGGEIEKLTYWDCLQAALATEIDRNLGAPPSKMAELKFLDFHDPGWMLLQDESGREITASFYYELIQYEDISTWKTNEPIAVILDDEKGIQLHRISTDKKYTVIFDADADPVADRLSECINAEQVDTYIFANCHSEAGNYYEKTAARLHDWLSANGGEALSKALAVEKLSWELYQETRNAAIREYLSDKYGTNQIIINANDYAIQMKARLDSLVRLLE